MVLRLQQLPVGMTSQTRSSMCSSSATSRTVHTTACSNRLLTHTHTRTHALKPTHTHAHAHAHAQAHACMHMHIHTLRGCSYLTVERYAADEVCQGCWPACHLCGRLRCSCGQLTPARCLRRHTAPGQGQVSGPKHHPFAAQRAAQHCPRQDLGVEPVAIAPGSNQCTDQTQARVRIMHTVKHLQI